MFRLAMLALSLIVMIPSLQAQDVNVISDKQREMVVNAIRSAVTLKFKNAFNDHDRAKIIDDAKSEPWKMLSGFVAEKASTFGRLPEELKDAAPVIVTPKGRGVLKKDWTRGADGFGRTGGQGYSLFCLDKLTNDQKLKVGEKNKWTEGKEVYVVTGTVEVDKKKAWRVVRMEFTDKEKARFDPRVK